MGGRGCPPSSGLCAHRQQHRREQDAEMRIAAALASLTLAIASEADHSPVSCDESTNPTQCRAYMQIFLTGGEAGPSAPTRTGDRADHTGHPANMQKK